MASACFELRLGQQVVRLFKNFSLLLIEEGGKFALVQHKLQYTPQQVHHTLQVVWAASVAAKLALQG